MSAAAARSFATHRWPELTVALALVAVLAIDWWWLDRFRHEFLLDIDEAGYVANAYDLSNALRDGAFSDFWNYFQHHGDAAPLVPLVTAPIHLVLGEGILRSFITQSAFLVLLAACVWGIGRRFSAAPWAALTVIVVLGIPELIDYTRHYHFAIAATALLTAATYALIRTERLALRGWSLAWGAAMGLTALSRTLAASFVPGLVLAAAVAVWASPEGRRQRVVNLGLGVFVGTAIAAVWWLENGASVIDYLTQQGFRDEPPTGVVTQESWGSIRQDIRALANVLYAPLALAVGVSLGVGGRAWWQRRRAAGSGLAEFARTDASIVAVTLLSGLAVLAIVSTGATGAGLTLMPLLVALAVGALARVPRGWVRRTLVGALVACAAFNVISKSGAVDALSGTTALDPPLPGDKRYTVFDGSGLIQRYVEHARYPPPANADPLPDLHRRWIPDAAGLARWMVDYAAEREQTPIVVTGEFDLMWNNNVIYLGARLVNEAFPVGRLQSIPDDRVSTYREQLTHANFLVITEPPPFRVGQPPVSPDKAEAAGRSLGFSPVLDFELADGRSAAVLWRDGRQPAGSATAGVALDDLGGRPDIGQ